MDPAAAAQAVGMFNAGSARLRKAVQAVLAHAEAQKSPWSIALRTLFAQWEQATPKRNEVTAEELEKGMARPNPRPFHARFSSQFPGTCLGVSSQRGALNGGCSPRPVCKAHHA